MAVIETAFFLSELALDGSSEGNQSEYKAAFKHSYGEDEGHALFLSLLEKPGQGLQDPRPLVRKLARKLCHAEDPLSPRSRKALGPSRAALIQMYRCPSLFCCSHHHQ